MNPRPLSIAVICAGFSGALLESISCDIAAPAIAYT
jgi:hypothetical protein